MWSYRKFTRDGENAEITSKLYLSLCYRFDSETGLYYLNSRYYNPEWGRFINADGSAGITGELLSHNLFSYCDNNSINREDPNGYFWGALVAAIGAVFMIPAEVASIITVGALVLAAATIYTAVNVAVQVHKNYVKYCNSGSTKSKPQGREQSNPGGRAKNKLKANPNAQGDHTTFRRNPNTGEITNYQTWKSNPRNPKAGFESDKRYIGQLRL